MSLRQNPNRRQLSHGAASRAGSNQPTETPRIVGDGGARRTLTSPLPSSLPNESHTSSARGTTNMGPIKGVAATTGAGSTSNTSTATSPTENSAAATDPLSLHVSDSARGSHSRRESEVDPTTAREGHERSIAQQRQTRSPDPATETMPATKGPNLLSPQDSEAKQVLPGDLGRNQKKGNADPLAPYEGTEEGLDTRSEAVTAPQRPPPDTNKRSQLNGHGSVRTDDSLGERHSSRHPQTEEVGGAHIAPPTRAVNGTTSATEAVSPTEATSTTEKTSTAQTLNSGPAPSEAPVGGSIRSVNPCPSTSSDSSSSSRQQVGSTDDTADDDDRSSTSGTSDSDSEPDSDSERAEFETQLKSLRADIGHVKAKGDDTELRIQRLEKELRGRMNNLETAAGKVSHLEETLKRVENIHVQFTRIQTLEKDLASRVKALEDSLVKVNNALFGDPSGAARTADPASPPSLGPTDDVGSGTKPDLIPPAQIVAPGGSVIPDNPADNPVPTTPNAPDPVKTDPNCPVVGRTLSSDTSTGAVVGGPAGDTGTGVVVCPQSPPEADTFPNPADPASDGKRRTTGVSGPRLNSDDAALEIKDGTVQQLFKSLEKKIQELVLMYFDFDIGKEAAENIARDHWGSAFPADDWENPNPSSPKLPWFRGLVANLIHTELFTKPFFGSDDEAIEGGLAGFERLITEGAQSADDETYEEDVSIWRWLTAKLMGRLFPREKPKGAKKPVAHRRLMTKINSEFSAVIDTTPAAATHLSQLCSKAIECAFAVRRTKSTYLWLQPIAPQRVSGAEVEIEIHKRLREPEPAPASGVYDVVFTVFGPLVKHNVKIVEEDGETVWESITLGRALVVVA